MHYNPGLFTAVSNMLLGPAGVPPKLNITAIGVHDGSSRLECWQLDEPFSRSTEPGTTGCATLQLGDLANTTYTVLPPHYDAPLHNAPFRQWVFISAGLAYITIPGDDSPGAYVAGGGFGLIFASDTADVSNTGHRTQYPGVSETVHLQIPTKDGQVPAHFLLHPGPCTANEMAGRSGLISGEY
ncbi:hypothetical protein F4779DRAFT_608746 [Xylariaceae sp. FL0662B]|nr:hypothetical protein F4779DRAFT_608746 [Xylariaceae sp. FL0662B]